MSFSVMGSRSEPNIYYEEETQSQRLARKSKETPFFPLAILVCLGSVAYGAYAFKNRGKMSISVYLMHLRVGAQGAAVASLSLGVLYTVITQHLLKKD